VGPTGALRPCGRRRGRSALHGCCMLHVCTLHVACCCGAKSIPTRSAAADPTGSDGGTDHCEWRGRHRADQSDGDTRHAAATRRNEVHARMPSLSAKTKFKQNHAQSSHAGAPTLAYEYAIRVPCRDASLRGARGEDLRGLCARPQCSRSIDTDFGKYANTVERAAWPGMADGTTAPRRDTDRAYAWERHLGYSARFCHRRRARRSLGSAHSASQRRSGGWCAMCLLVRRGGVVQRAHCRALGCKSRTVPAPTLHCPRTVRRTATEDDVDGDGPRGLPLVGSNT
jgi:hypothetical protein